MKPDTKAIRAMADACFRAPWTAGAYVVKCDIVEHADSGYEDCDGEHDVERIESPEEYPDGQVIADVPGMAMFSKPHAAFIAAARTDVPALCDRVEALEAALLTTRARGVDGEPCWCHISPNVSSTGKHATHCLDKRAVLEGS